MEDPHHIDVMYNWFKYSVSKAPPHVIDKKEKRKWKIEYVEPYGRCTIATQDIKEGEVLFVDHPVVTGPKQTSDVMCLACYRRLGSWDDYQCSKCGWPLCGPECETRGYHPLECNAFAASGYTPRQQDFQEAQYMYEAMLPLRCYCLSKMEPDKWQTLIAMESHNDLRRGTELWEREQTNVVDYLVQKVKVPVEEEVLHTITGILDVNCHEVRSNIPGTRDQYLVRGIYPLCAMMSHFCVNNTHHTLMDDMTMVVIASTPIKKGEQMTATYTHILSATTERRKHLRYGKFFDCACARCADPTELGTYFGALRCSQPGCGGNILSTDPLAPANDAPWACDRCRYKVSAVTVERLNKMVYMELRQAGEDDPIKLETIFKKYQYVLHPQHFHLVGMKHSLSQMYGRLPGYLLPELTEAHLVRKVACCRDLLQVLDVLDPGITRLRGLTLYELHAPLLMQANRAFQNKAITKSDFQQQLHEVEGYLDRTVYCLKHEPLSSFEGEICKIARNSLQELRKWIQTVETLQESHFLPEKQEVVLGQLSEEDLTLETLLKKLEEQ
ncbi:SET domain-containing protein SmydA-8 [Procambarus clarkii]|uniref:SET domain-containing protein SmydA-8 n=1 Tax=Procambarus clarkii TaxID=6728 RepID=UPI001E67189C|nr:SET domain-containing protein SmydA-8-like [Procambarus clarkii]XP_045604502.1 SET domain-containing protein SmydA-8-like [Procambarus clarkii]XP_045604510.1 SET domain-containing protein SmydA-8-like [Procambarus clarkii]XP_045604517.1 SET domain-containing protein SmydA-8-like [Procambarus clarkii]XP_045604524.1 SET domain-containing protein SmydA-8-like [Procambarus clarkii]XP_045604531.1 SET domain-containing protein SmydA-8-like [Procambarus clarkii]